MENSYDFNAQMNVPKIELPNATAILILGIVSIPTCCCYGIVGLICAIIALVLAKSATALYVSEPGKYTEGSYKNMNAGKICAWIGLVLSVIYLLFNVWAISSIGLKGLSDPNAVYEFLESLGISVPQ